MQRQNTIIRIILIIAAWSCCGYRVYIDFDHCYWFDDLIHKSLISFASIISVTCIYLDYKRYQGHKTASSFVSGAATIVSVVILLLIVDQLKEQDRTSTILYASKCYSDLNTISLEFRENGTYKCGISIFFGDSYYTRGRYIIKDSIIYLDKSNLYDIIKSDRLLMKLMPKNDTAKKQGLLGILLGLPKPSHDNSPEKFLFQIDNKGAISSAIALRVNEDFLAVKR
jgi:hypothetical protein